MWSSENDCAEGLGPDIVFFGCGECSYCQARINRALATAGHQQRYFGEPGIRNPLSIGIQILLAAVAYFLIRFLYSVLWT